MAQQIDQDLAYNVEADAVDWVKETALPPELLNLETKTVHSSTYTSPKLVARYGGRRSLPFYYVITASVGNILAASLANSDVGSRPRAPDINGIDRSEFVLRLVSVAKYPPPSVVLF